MDADDLHDEFHAVESTEIVPNNDLDAVEIVVDEDISEPTPSADATTEGSDTAADEQPAELRLSDFEVVDTLGKQFSTHFRRIGRLTYP